MSTYEQLNEEIKRRFPDAKFRITCFANIDEIYTKVLVENMEQINLFDYRGDNMEECFIIYVRRKEGARHILYADAIDSLIKANTGAYDNCHKFLSHFKKHDDDITVAQIQNTECMPDDVGIFLRRKITYQTYHANWIPVDYDRCHWNPYERLLDNIFRWY